MGELLPCPFCGSADLWPCQHPSDHPHAGYRFVRCCDCSADGPFGHDADDAITLWNVAPRAGAWEPVHRIPTGHFAVIGPDGSVHYTRPLEDLAHWAAEVAAAPGYRIMIPTTPSDPGGEHG